MDNFEWNSGLIPRFGCVYVNYDTFERTPKESSKQVIKVGTVSERACR